MFKRFALFLCRKMVRSVLISQAFFAFVRQKSYRWIQFFGVAADDFPGSIEVIFHSAPSWIKKNRLSTKGCREAIFLRLLTRYFRGE